MTRTPLAAALLLGTTSAFAAPGSGDLWEVTSQFAMEGMPSGMMPARSQQLCAAKEWTKPPVATDEQQRCETIDFKNTPTSSVWKMRCAGPPAMTGNGEITRTSPDSYKGVINMSTEQGALTINVAGRRLGECDVEVAKADRDAQSARIQAQVAAGEKMAADAKQQMCMLPAQSLNLVQLNQQAMHCEGPLYKAAFCDKLKTQEGFEMACVREKADPANALVAVAAHCGADAAELSKTACDALAKTEQKLDVIGACCPAVAKTIAARECGGMKYTAQMAVYGSFCATYAKDAVAGGEPGPTPSPSPDSTTSKAKKKLKSIFGK